MLGEAVAERGVTEGEKEGGICGVSVAERGNEVGALVGSVVVVTGSDVLGRRVSEVGLSIVGVGVAATSGGLIGAFVGAVVANGAISAA